MAKKIKKKVMANGGSVQDPLTQYFDVQFKRKTNRLNYIQNPNETLAENEIAKAKAMEKSNNWLTTTLDVGGGIALNAGLNKLSGGLSSLGGPKEAVESTIMPELAGLVGYEIPQIQMPNIQRNFAMGGKVKKVPVEVEGDEVAQLPNGSLIDFEGPTHEQGGIQTQLPESTTVYSDRLKDNKGLSMAERKKNREKELSALKKKAKGGDMLAKNTLKRRKLSLEKEEDFDLQLQEQADNLDNYFNPKLVYGSSGVEDSEDLEDSDDLEEVFMKTTKSAMNRGLIMPENNFKATPLDKNLLPGIPIPTKPESLDSPGIDWNKYIPKNLPTGGDVLGIYGNLKQAIDPMKTTLASRSSDTPNQNHFKEYGKEGLKSLQEMKEFLGTGRDLQLRKLEENAISKRSTLRNTARGINTLRALDLATDAQKLDAMNNIHTNFANQMLGVLSQEAGTKNQIDQMVMRGEESADLVNRHDKDAFYSQLNRDQQAMGEAITRTGKVVNQMKERDTNNNFLNMLSDYFDIDTKTGKIKVKDGVNISRDKTDIPGEDKNDNSDFKEFINPQTNQAFKNKKEWDAYQKQMKENPFLDTPVEANTEYKTYIDPRTNKPFTNKKDYDKLLAAGKEAKVYEGADLVQGNSFSKNFKTSNHEEAKSLLGKYLMNNKMPSLNIDLKDDVKKLQKLLGIKADGIFGNDVFKALKKAI